MDTLIKTCEAASGEDNCTVAEMPEINVLLSALLLREEKARLASLLVSNCYCNILRIKFVSYFI